MPIDLYASQGQSAPPSAPPLDLYSNAAEAPEAEAPIESNSLIQDLAPTVKTISHIPQNVATSLANTGQNISNTMGDLLDKSDTWNALKHYVQKKTGISLPRTINMEEQFGINDENRQPITQEVTGLGTDLALTSIAPPLRLAKYIPAVGKASNTVKGLLNYGTDIAQNSALMGGLNAIEGKSAGEGALAGGVSTAAVNPLVQSLKSGNPVVRLAGAGALGLLGTYGAQKAIGTDNPYADIAGATLAASLGLRGRNAKDLAIMNLLKDVDLKRAMPRIQASERLGLEHIRPSEAMNSGYIGGIEGAVGNHPETALFLEKKAEGRQASEKKAINNLYDTTFQDKTMSPLVDKLYKSSYQASVSPKFLQSLEQNEIFNSAVNRVENSPAFREKLKGVPKNSFAYLDQVKRAMDAMAEEAPSAEASIINETKNNMLKRMDTINASYKQARGLAQREIIKNKMMEAVNEEELKGTSFFQKNLRNDEKFEDIMRGLKGVPNAQRQARDARDVFRVLIDSNVKTPRTGAKLSATSMSSPRSTWQAFIHKLQGKEYDMAMAELMTDPKWFKKVSLAKRMAEPNEKARYLANLISRVTGQSLSDVIGSPDNSKQEE